MATLVFSEAEMRDGWRARRVRVPRYVARTCTRGKVRKVRLCLI